MKSERIIILTAKQATKAAMPKYYPASRCGAHKSIRDYDRNRMKRELRKELP